MQAKYKPGDIVYILRNSVFVERMRVVRAFPSNGTYILRFADRSEPAGIRLQESRIFSTKHAAEVEKEKNEYRQSNQRQRF